MLMRDFFTTIKHSRAILNKPWQKIQIVHELVQLLVLDLNFAVKENQQ